MKNTILTLLAFLLLVSVSAFAQGKKQKQSARPMQAIKLNVKSNDKFFYDVNLSMETIMSMEGQEMSMNGQSNGLGLLAATDANRDRINWSYDMKNMHVKFGSAMIPGQAKDTVIDVPTQHFTTDADGKVLSIDKPSIKGSQMMEMMSSLSSKRQLKQWFAPESLKGRKPGESWEEKGIDTVTMDAMSMNMQTASTMKYTFEGTVDTLGVKAARVRTESTAMTMEGTMSMGGMDMSIEGDGATSGLSYYSVKDGLLLASDVETQMNIRVSMAGMDEVIPMTQKTTTTMVRAEVATMNEMR